MAELITTLPEQLNSVLPSEMFLHLNANDRLFAIISGSAKDMTTLHYAVKTNAFRAAKELDGQVYVAIKKAWICVCSQAFCYLSGNQRLGFPT
ncbi:hypothetical protein [Paenibacillus sp. SI8]|uniref:hypothetical protein n=1 Tax=unclassified Paenibacillus TaxID=185978 RepID=UPI0034662B50